MILDGGSTYTRLYTYAIRAADRMWRSVRPLE